MSEDIDDGGPAFPTTQVTIEHDEHGDAYASPALLGGMSLRDYFAGQLLASGGWDMMVTKLNQPGATPEDAARLIARTAYDVADVMLAARKKGPEA